MPIHAKVCFVALSKIPKRTVLLLCQGSKKGLFKSKTQTLTHLVDVVEAFLRTCAMLCADPYPFYNYLRRELNKFKLLYIHMVEPRIGSQMNVIEVDESDKSLKPFKKLSNAAFIAAGG